MGLEAISMALALAAAAAGAAAPPHDAAADRILLDVVGACPDQALVAELLAPLLSPEQRRQSSASIWDQGSRYRVAVGESATTLDDPVRDCPARARESAAVVANELRSHPLILGPPRWTIEKGLVFDVAPGTSGPAWAPGAEFRGALGSGTWSLVGSAGARGPATLSFQDGSKAELLRFPLDAGMRATAYWGRFRPWLVVGASLTPTGVLAEDTAHLERQWHAEVGALVMLGATLRIAGRIGVAAAFNFRWQPRPYQVQTASHGTVGETPPWWLGLSLNYTLDGQASRP